MVYKVTLDKEGCISCGLCENTCPEVFKMADDNKAEVIKAEIGDDLFAKANEAAEGCPVTVIKVEKQP